MNFLCRSCERIALLNLKFAAQMFFCGDGFWLRSYKFFNFLTDAGVGYPQAKKQKQAMPILQGCPSLRCEACGQVF